MLSSLLLTSCVSSSLSNALKRNDIFIENNNPQLEVFSFKNYDIWFNQSTTNAYQYLNGEWCLTNQSDHDYERINHSWRKEKDYKKAIENAFIRSVFSANCTYEQKRFSNNLLFESVLQLHAKNESYTTYHYHYDDTDSFLYWKKEKDSAYFIYDNQNLYHSISSSTRDETFKILLNKASPYSKLNIPFSFNHFLEKLNSLKVNGNKVTCNPFLYESNENEVTFMTYDFTISNDWLYIDEMIVYYLKADTEDSISNDTNLTTSSELTESERVEVRFSNFGTTVIDNSELDGEKYTISL